MTQTAIPADPHASEAASVLGDWVARARNDRFRRLRDAHQGARPDRRDVALGIAVPDGAGFRWAWEREDCHATD
jgi:hypothetical protein